MPVCFTARYVSHMLEKGAVPLVSTAAAVYILCCLPHLLVPSGLLGALLLLVTGAVAGVTALAAGTVRTSLP